MGNGCVTIRNQNVFKSEIFKSTMQKILVIQTAFIGDAVLATGILEKLHVTFPTAAIDFMVRKGNESLFASHPFLNKVIVWDKTKSKYKHLFELLQQIRETKYDVVINLQRFAATGFLTAFSKATMTIGFDKNPLSFLFTTKVKHIVSNALNPMHEIERNQMLISSIAGGEALKPKLYPSNNDEKIVTAYTAAPFICIAPASVWFTKQFPIHKWVELVNEILFIKIYLIGAKTDVTICNEIIKKSNHQNIESLAGKLSFLQSAALMKQAKMNYVNDSAPMHFASSVEAPTTAVYCSTLPSFGFGPLSIKSFIVETPTTLACRPCGLHGRKDCPLSHFNCANNIQVNQLTHVLTNQ
jgi:heptosyltransferase-2